MRVFAEETQKKDKPWVAVGSSKIYLLILEKNSIL